jgi:secreted PhoX family phosphatase
MNRNESRRKIAAFTGFLLALAVGPAAAQDVIVPYTTTAGAQVKGLQGWQVQPLFTVGETIKKNAADAGYTPPGILDGIGAVKLDGNNVRVLVNHELGNSVGYEYELANGTKLKGARVSYFDINSKTRQITGAGLAYDTVYDHKFDTVTSSAQLTNGTGGFNRFCSSGAYRKGELSFRDDTYLTGEETANGQQWALDIATRRLWAVPALGRGAWENSTPLNISGNRVALIEADDTDGGPLYLYIGKKNAATPEILDFYGWTELPDALVVDDFLNRNGLLVGTLYAFAADDPSKTDVSTFNGTGNSLSGHWVALDRSAQLGTVQSDLVANAFSKGAFGFSRAEDVSTNPRYRKEFVLASTGSVDVYGGADTWGTVYIFRTNFITLSCQVKISYDGNDAGAGQFSGPDYGLRSPDNLDWADNGKIYLQEDDAYDAGFGATSGEEASVWELNPSTGKLVRVARIDRTAALPGGQTNGSPSDIGNWETSGVLDVTKLFRTTGGERLLIIDVQAHSVRNGSIGGNARLVQGGQLLFLSKNKARDDDDENDD